MDQNGEHTKLMSLSFETLTFLSSRNFSQALLSLVFVYVSHQVCQPLLPHLNEVEIV